MKHTIKEIVSGTIAKFQYVCASKVYYHINVEDSIYQLEIDSDDEDWKTTHLVSEYKAITLMRWIRKGIDNEQFIQIK